jgi:shikimate dehydrogenase
LIHNAAFAALHLDWVYTAFEVAPGAVPEALTGMRALGIAGLNVTMPHKEPVARAVDECTADAEALQAVNTVVNRDGRLIGHNTDGAGFLDGLRADLGFDPAGHACGVIGAGGAARAVVRALGEAGATSIIVVNRNPERADAAVALAGGSGRVGAAEELADVDLVVHATPIGMGGTDSEADLPLPADVFGSGQHLYDLIYSPPFTPLMRAAESRGVTVASGLGMLIGQAARAFELWTGEAAPVAAMRAAVEADVTGSPTA